MDDTQASFPSITLSGTIIQFIYDAQHVPTIINNQKNKIKHHASVTLLTVNSRSQYSNFQFNYTKGLKTTASPPKQVVNKFQIEPGITLKEF